MQRAQRTGTTSPPLQHKNTQSRPCNVQQCSNGISNGIRQSHQSEAAPCKRTHRRVAVRQSCVDCRVQTLSTRRDGCIARLVFDQRVFAEEIADAEARELLLGRSAGDHPRNDHLSAGSRDHSGAPCAPCANASLRFVIQAQQLAVNSVHAAHVWLVASCMRTVLHVVALVALLPDVGSMLYVVLHPLLPRAE